MIQAAPVVWPPKHELLGVNVTATSYDEATDVILRVASRRQASVVSLHAVHALVTAAGDAELRDRVNQFDMVASDGQPVRWALNWLYRAGLRDRVYGPELTLRICAAAADAGESIYLFGSTELVLASLSENLREKFPALKIAGVESPPFRPLTEADWDASAERIRQSGASIVFVGLGAPKQDFAGWELRRRVDAVHVCVGAAFDFHAGKKKIAPAWMQRRGLEWAFRLSQEPGRLWKRYLVTNSVFVGKLAWQAATGRRATY
jgi:N-acetylglucosaminyldiphosphoundecaprenol N-acetyl-beta-D-mannosaminyltransferase